MGLINFVLEEISAKGFFFFFFFFFIFFFQKKALFNPTQKWKISEERRTKIAHVFLFNTEMSFLHDHFTSEIGSNILGLKNEMFV
jgi:K+-transporting ATPase A subunit